MLACIAFVEAVLSVESLVVAVVLSVSVVLAVLPAGLSDLAPNSAFADHKTSVVVASVVS